MCTEPDMKNEKGNFLSVLFVPGTSDCLTLFNPNFILLFTGDRKFEVISCLKSTTRNYTMGI